MQSSVQHEYAQSNTTHLELGVLILSIFFSFFSLFTAEPLIARSEVWYICFCFFFCFFGSRFLHHPAPLVWTCPWREVWSSTTGTWARRWMRLDHLRCLAWITVIIWDPSTHTLPCKSKSAFSPHCPAWCSSSISPCFCFFARYCNCFSGSALKDPS